jgi:response regulator NasT
MQDYFERMLPRLGHEVVSVAETGRQLIEHCRIQRPDLVITDIRMPEMDGIEAAVEIYREMALPVILVSAHHEQSLVERAEADHIMAYLIKPIKLANLEPAIALAVRRFQQFQALRAETADLKQALENRKLVERAKGMVMTRSQLDEPSAFRRLQRIASERNVKLVVVARAILTAEEAYRKDEE